MRSTLTEATVSVIELAVRVKRGSRTVFDSTISIPVNKAEAGSVRPVVEQWIGLMEASLQVIHRALHHQRRGGDSFYVDFTKADA